jgi:hypothetical protein
MSEEMEEVLAEIKRVLGIVEDPEERGHLW